MNENDSVSDEELWFSDNDELVWLVAEYFKAKVLILLTNQDWVFKDFWNKQQSLITIVSCVDDVEKHLSIRKVRYENDEWNLNLMLWEKH